MTFKILKVNHYQQLTKVLPTKLTIRPKIKKPQYLSIYVSIYYIYRIYNIYNIYNYYNHYQYYPCSRSRRALTSAYNK